MMVYVWAVSDADKRIKLPGKAGHTCLIHLLSWDIRDVTTAVQSLCCESLYRTLIEMSAMFSSQDIHLNYLYCM